MQETYIADTLIRATELTRPLLPDNPKILYPACGEDISLETVFPVSNITYLDPSPVTCGTLLKNIQRRVMQIELPDNNFTEKFNLIVLMNSHVQDQCNTVLSLLGAGGFVLTQGLSWNFDAEEFLMDERYNIRSLLVGNTPENYTMPIGESLNGYRTIAHKRTPEELRTQFEKHASWYLFSKK